MRTARVILLIAAGLLTAAELVSVSLFLREFSDQQANRSRIAVEQAASVLPRVADWVRAQAENPSSAPAPSIDPFDRVTLEEEPSPSVNADLLARLEKGELVAMARMPERELSVFGLVHTFAGPRVFRLTEAPSQDPRLATYQTLVAQHAFILLAALVGFLLVGFAPRSVAPESPPVARAYEEAMSRLRLRDDERRAAFERERSTLNSILRDREAMARAGELTAGIVHEVRNSLGAIAAQAKLIEALGDERARPGVAAIADEVRTLQSVMARFLDFIRSEEVRFEEFDLGRMVSRVAAREGANHGVKVSVEGSETRVGGDEDLLERSIENVIRNACQAAGPSGHVSVKFGADDAHAFVIVDDDGPGIENAERALRPFESSRAGGLGLGLPLALKILSLHQGTLDLSRRPQGGTQTFCRWPKMDPTATSGNARSVPQAPAPDPDTAEPHS